jgi:hypothetical protein
MYTTNSTWLVLAACLALLSTRMVAAEEMPATNVQPQAEQAPTAPAPPQAEQTPAPPAERQASQSLEARVQRQDDLMNRRIPGIELYVDREGWQSGIGYRAMQDYVQRLANVCREQLPGLVRGIAGGKRGILLQVTFKGQRKLYFARQNTEEFLTAIVKDLATLPEPVALGVHVTHNQKEIIRAEHTGREVKVTFLL